MIHTQDHVAFDFWGLYSFNFSSSINLAANFIFLYSRLKFHLCMHHVFITHFPVNGPLHWSRFSDIVKRSSGRLRAIVWTLIVCQMHDWQVFPPVLCAAPSPEWQLSSSHRSLWALWVMWVTSHLSLPDLFSLTLLLWLLTNPSQSPTFNNIT